MSVTKVQIIINGFGNSHFNDEQDVVYALRELANRIEEGSHTSKVLDINGNKVGTVEWEY